MWRRAVETVTGTPATAEGASRQVRHPAAGCGAYGASDPAVRSHRFVLGRRIARVSAFLRAPQLSIGAVGRLVGFRTPSHFTTAFRRMTSITPSAHRCGWRHER